MLDPGKCGRKKQLRSRGRKKGIIIICNKLTPCMCVAVLHVPCSLLPVAVTNAATPSFRAYEGLKHAQSLRLVIFIKSRRVVLLECKVNQTAHVAHGPPPPPPAAALHLAMLPQPFCLISRCRSSSKTDARPRRVIHHFAWRTPESSTSSSSDSPNPRFPIVFSGSRHINSQVPNAFFISPFADESALPLTWP